MAGVLFTVSLSSNKNIGGRVECQHNEQITTLVEVRDNLNYKVTELPTGRPWISDVGR